MINNIPKFYDPSNNFYNGMTLNEARQKGIDKSFWRRDFSDIDHNQDGKLSIKEIMNERQKILTRRKVSSVVWGGIGATDIFFETSRLGKFIDLGIDLLFCFSDIYQINKISKQNKVYNKIISDNNLDVNA